MNEFNPSEPNIVSPGADRLDRFRPNRLAWIPFPVLFVAIVGLWFSDVQAPHESPGLLIALSILLTTLPALGIAFLFARNFWTTGGPGVVLFGCGALLWGASGLSPAFAFLTPESGFNANMIVTSHNLMVWGASLCYLAGASLLQRGSPSLTHRAHVLLVAYALALAVAAFMIFMTFQEWTPVFFVQGKGASPERQFVLGSTIVAILQTLLLLRGGAKLRRSPFLDWFVLALLLLVLGYAGIMLQTIVGSLLGWVSRAAQYLGGGYMLVAAYVAFRDTKAPVLVTAASQDKAPHRYSVAIAIVLIAAILRLVFLQALGMQVAFLTLYPAVVLAALYGGLRPGILATLLAAALGDYFWMEPVGSVIMAHAIDWLALAIFVFNCLLISWIVERLQKAQSRLWLVEAERRGELERTVLERTAELGLANEARSRLLEAATATEAELQAVFDSVPAGIWITRDPTCRTMQGNRLGNTWMRIPGGSNASKSAPDPSILRFDVFDKDGLPVPNDELPMQRAALGEEVLDYEFEWRFSNGESRFLYGNAIPLRDADGNTVGGVAAFIDVSERKRAEAALRKSEEQERLRRHELEAILEAIPAAVFVAEDPACAYMRINRAGQEILRLPAHANASKSGPDGEATQHFEVQSNGRVLLPEELPLQRAAATKSIIKAAEFELLFTDGDRKYFLGNALPLLDDEGEVRGAVGAFVDITDRKLAFDALRESEERLRHLGDSLPDGAIYRYGHEAGGTVRFHYISAGIEPMNGVRVEDVLQDAGVLHHQILPEYLAKLAEAEQVSASEMSDFRMDVPMRHPNGETRWMRLQSRPHRMNDGSVIWDGVQTDITERKRHEEQISLLMREVNHRAKNMLALVLAIARQTAAAKPLDFIRRFEERIRALAASQDLLVKNEWKGVDIQDLIPSQLAHFQDLIETRITLRGQSLIVLASAAQTIGMALHELATNAGKYGALSIAAGRVEIIWELQRTENGEECFIMVWRECGGPPVTTPAQTGFGSIVISRMAEMSLDANVTLNFASDGLIWRLQCPIDKVLEGSAPFS